MQMEMVYGLAAVFAGIHHDAVAFREAFVAGDLRGHPEEVTEQSVLIRSGLGKRINMLARNDQNMYGSLGIDVGKGVDAFVLVDGGGRIAGNVFVQTTPPWTILPTAQILNFP